MMVEIVLWRGKGKDLSLKNPSNAVTPFSLLNLYLNPTRTNGLKHMVKLN